MGRGGWVAYVMFRNKRLYYDEIIFKSLNESFLFQYVRDAHIYRGPNVFVLLVLVLLVLLVFLALVLLVPFLLVLVTGEKQRHLQVCTCPRSLTKDTILYGYVVAKCQATSRRSWTLDNVSSRGPRYGHHMSA